MSVPDLAMNMLTFFDRVPLDQRPPLIRAAGVAAVELPWPLDVPGTHSLDSVARAIADAGLSVALAGAPLGDIMSGKRGRSSDPAQVSAWREEFVRSLDYTVRVRSPLIAVNASTRLPGVTEAAQLDCFITNLQWAAAEAKAAGVRVISEATSTSTAPGFLVPHVTMLLDILDSIGNEAGLMMDPFHAGEESDDPVALTRLAGERIWHAQVADYPGRHEPGTGKLDFPGYLNALQEVGYAGSLGLELFPLRPAADIVTDVRNRMSDRGFRLVGAQPI